MIVRMENCEPETNFASDEIVRFINFLPQQYARLLYLILGSSGSGVKAPEGLERAEIKKLAIATSQH
jgi:hypothetical protein